MLFYEIQEIKKTDWFSTLKMFILSIIVITYLAIPLKLHSIYLWPLR